MRRDHYECEDIRELMEVGAQLVDVRTPEEYILDALPGSINLPLQRIASAPQSLNPDRPVLVYCGSGQRSEQARVILTDIGFKHVKNIGGYHNYQHCH